MSLLNRAVLVLNQSYEPLHICDVKRAIILIVTQKASLVKTVNHQVIRTVSQEFPVPSVIRIQRYVNIKYWEPVLSKENIFRRDRYTCQYCGATGVELTIDHVIPKVLGGEDSWTNLVTACVKCNNKKGNKTPEQAGMKLLNKPRKVHRIHTLQKFLDSPIEEWRPFLFMD
ncbi:MAG TPA: HNH endonuclease [Deltaproteobacteria bacterium]|nr:HNH endonuclease [Candidatus Neomarinimicrobiota bacterium]HDM75681.1 HNH endonuclease [Deltaproteobacteria bacterium]MCD6101040.1 HNH endonuclease [Candidatus Neomarinimicrobiota bacterium]RKY48534.1 MAG: HNH endonuclease [Candidatus Neomarinimicrobiota bacterium]RKY50870.1 MAG: HNH endonuclease [Candidatus Neomarinimicrobiota bacterium]